MKPPLLRLVLFTRYFSAAVMVISGALIGALLVDTLFDRHWGLFSWQAIVFLVVIFAVGIATRLLSNAARSFRDFLRT